MKRILTFALLFFSCAALGQQRININTGTFGVLPSNRVQTVPVGANPTAMVSGTAVNGVATTFMRSDAAPALGAATASVLGGVKPDGTTIANAAGAISVAYGAAANTAAQGNDRRIGVTLTTGTARTLANAAEIIVCTGACTITPPAVLTPGDQFCVQAGDNVAAIITLAASTSIQYEGTARTSYGVANHTMTSGGAVKDQICMVAINTTQYNVFSSTGTWTNTP